MENKEHSTEKKEEGIINSKLLKKKLEKLSAHPVTVVALVVMIGVSIFQTYELITLKQNISEGVVAPVQASSDISPVPESLNNLPDMVGGC